MPIDEFCQGKYEVAFDEKVVKQIMERELACRTYFVKHIGYVDYDEVEKEPQTVADI